jgi:DNA polymerase-4
MSARAILHVDMDAFYASVEQRDHPELAGKPVIVGGTGGRGVVAAANYEVRKYGVHSAMPMREALRRCPHAVCIAPRMRRYQEVSRQVFAIFLEFTPVVEGLSLDEAFLDITASESLFGGAVAIAQTIKSRIRASTGLTASVGLASNKLLAKIASDLRKPDGFMQIAPGDAAAVMSPLPISRLSGIGRKTAARLEGHAIHTLGELSVAPDSVLWPIFGRFARRVRERAVGIDDRPVVADAEDRSISAEETFAEDIRDHARLQSELAALTDRTCARLRTKNLMTALVTVKIRRKDFTTYTRQKSFAPPTQDTGLILGVARELLATWLETQPRAAIRLLGVGVAQLAAASQLELFEGTQQGSPARLDAAVDRIHEKFGGAALQRASGVRVRDPTSG